MEYSIGEIEQEYSRLKIELEEIELQIEKYEEIKNQGKDVEPAYSAKLERKQQLLDEILSIKEYCEEKKQEVEQKNTSALAVVNNLKQSYDFLDKQYKFKSKRIKEQMEILKQQIDEASKDVQKLNIPNPKATMELEQIIKKIEAFLNKVNKDKEQEVNEREASENSDQVLADFDRMKNEQKYNQPVIKAPRYTIHGIPRYKDAEQATLNQFQGVDNKSKRNQQVNTDQKYTIKGLPRYKDAEQATLDQFQGIDNEHKRNQQVNTDQKYTIKGLPRYKDVEQATLDQFQGIDNEHKRNQQVNNGTQDDFMNIFFSGEPIIPEDQPKEKIESKSEGVTDSNDNNSIDINEILNAMLESVKEDIKKEDEQAKETKTEEKAVADEDIQKYLFEGEEAITPKLDVGPQYIRQLKPIVGTDNKIKTPEEIMEDDVEKMEGDIKKIGSTIEKIKEKRNAELANDASEKEVVNDQSETNNKTTRQLEKKYVSEAQRAAILRYLNPQATKNGQKIDKKVKRNVPKEQANAKKQTTLQKIHNFFFEEIYTPEEPTEDKSIEGEEYDGGKSL